MKIGQLAFSWQTHPFDSQFSAPPPKSILVQLVISQFFSSHRLAKDEHVSISRALLTWSPDILLLIIAVLADIKLWQGLKSHQDLVSCVKMWKFALQMTIIFPSSHSPFKTHQLQLSGDITASRFQFDLFCIRLLLLQVFPEAGVRSQLRSIWTLF